MTPLSWYRTVVVLVGGLSGGLLVRALDQGLSGQPRPLTVPHLLLGLLLALVVQPGPLLGFLVTPASGERARGLAVGGSAVTAFVAVVGGALLWVRLRGPAPSVLAEELAFLWAVLALPLAAVDAWRLRRGAGSPPAPTAGGPPGPGEPPPPAA